MDTAEIRRRFAERVHELCDALQIPSGHGRQAALGRRFNVTPKAARKWLQGSSFPELGTAIAMCDAAGINLNWFLQGVGPKTGEKIDRDALRLAEGLHNLPTEQRTVALEFLRFQFQQADGWFTNEALAQYMDSIDTMRRSNGNVRGTPLKT
jgi:transcriptional regulator with XRE-family HTH domain